MFLFLFLKVKIFAPNAEQMHMVNHLKSSPTEEKRNVLEESARRAQGDPHGLADPNSSELDAVIIPGERAENCEANCSLYLMLTDFKILSLKG